MHMHVRDHIYSEKLRTTSVTFFHFYSQTKLFNGGGGGGGEKNKNKNEQGPGPRNYTIHTNNSNILPPKKFSQTTATHSQTFYFTH